MENKLGLQPIPQYKRGASLALYTYNQIIKWNGIQL